MPFQQVFIRKPQDSILNSYITNVHKQPCARTNHIFGFYFGGNSHSFFLFSLFCWFFFGYLCANVGSAQTHVFLSNFEFVCAYIKWLTYGICVHYLWTGGPFKNGANSEMSRSIAKRRERRANTFGLYKLNAENNVWFIFKRKVPPPSPSDMVEMKDLIC